MEEMIWRKIQCSGGHWSPVLGQGDALPPRCPECGRPYDRRLNRPVRCREDGTVPEDGKGVVPAEDKGRRESLSEESMHAGKKQTGSANTEVSHTESRRRNVRHTDSQHVTSRRMVDQRDTESVIPLRRTIPSTGTDRTEYGRVQGIPEAPPKKFNTCGVNCQGKELELSPEGDIFGRKGRFDHVCVTNRLISREHALVTPDPRGVRIRDLGSLNGTFIRSEEGRIRLLKGETVVLQPGQVFWLADQMFVVSEGSAAGR